MTAVLSAGTDVVRVSAKTGPVSLSQMFSQILLDAINGHALKCVDRDISRLHSKLNHPSMTSERKAAQVSYELRQLQGMRNCLVSTLKQPLS